MKKYPYPVIDMEATGKNITERRKKAGYSVKDLSEEFDFTGPQAVYNWQHGESLPTIENLILLAKLFDANVEDLVCLKNEKEMEAGDSRSPLILNVHFIYLHTSIVLVHIHHMHTGTTDHQNNLFRYVYLWQLIHTP